MNTCITAHNAGEPTLSQAHSPLLSWPCSELTEGTKLAEKELTKNKGEQWMCLCWSNSLYYKMKIKVSTKEEDGTAGDRKKARLQLCLFLQELEQASY